MRGRWFVIVLVLAACTVRGRLPRPGDVGISLRANVRADARITAPPPPPPPVVAIVNAPVPEFFGIPLEGVQDVVFVLDCSGSMEEPAIGQLAQIPVTTTPPTATTESATSTVDDRTDGAATAAAGPITTDVAPSEPPPPADRRPSPPHRRRCVARSTSRRPSSSTRSRVCPPARA